MSTHFQVGKTTIERWYGQFYRQKSQHSVHQHCSPVLGIDEHRFSRKQAYLITLCDLKHHKVYDLLQGESEKALGPYLNQLIGKERVRLVCIDLSKSYRSIVKKHFPNAKIVADRFHVIRPLFYHTLKTYHFIDPELKYQRGLLAALRTHPDRLSRKRAAIRDAYFKQQPAIASFYHRLQELYALLIKKCRTKKQCRRLIPGYLGWVARLKASPLLP